MQAKPIPPLTPEQIESFWSRVEVHHPAACWEWRGPITTSGYGVYTISLGTHNKAQSVRAHRIAYTLLIGPIPDGMTPDHLCRNRACVNPDHIEIVTEAENVLRGYGPLALNARKTHCKRGHEFTPENTSIGPEGGRRCRECIRMSSRSRPRPGRYKRKTDPEQIRERDAAIIARRASGDSARTIAKSLGIGLGSVYRTINREKGAN